VGFEVHALPVVSAGDDTSVALGQSVQLNGVASGSGLLVYQWNPASVLNIVNIPDPVYSGSADSVVFTLIVSDVYGCIDSSHVTVRVYVPDAIVLPNIITPDGNGKNDTWKINSRVDLAGSRLIIFNRWGETVFYEQNYSNDWGGTYMNTGEKLPDATYYYELTVPSQDNHLYKGAINILNSSAK
jgi:gliding motility-associated-like protein